MKKLIALVLATLMATAAASTVVAAEVKQDSDTKTVDSVITTSIKPAYTVTIPADVTVAFNALTTDFGSIEVTQAQIDPDKCIKVALICDGELNNKADPEKVIPYTVLAGEDVFTFETYLAAGDRTDLTVNIAQDDWNKAYAGEYSDTVTFEVSYISK